MDHAITRWNSAYFEGALSDTVMSHLNRLDVSEQRPEVQVFLERMFKNMNQAGFTAYDFTEDLAQQLFGISRLVEDVWDGFVLPFTLEGRHGKIDQYLAHNQWAAFTDGKVLMDMGCGFPPVTAVETAERFPRSRVVGVDPSLPHYLVYDADESYATFDRDGQILYFQGGPGRSLDTWYDPETARQYFQTVLEELLPHVPEDASTEQQTVKRAGRRLLVRPVNAYERANLTFLKGGIGEVDTRPVDAVRCFNVMFYFDRTFRSRAMDWFTETLNEAGLLLIGVNGDHSTRCRYSVYQNENGVLQHREFAFSVDNIRPLGGVTWASFHDDDYETNQLIEVLSVLRSDRELTRALDARLDALLREHELYERASDGYLVFLNRGLPESERERRRCAVNETLEREGFVDRAAAVLREAGFDAWRNEAGHVALAP